MAGLKKHDIHLCFFICHLQVPKVPPVTQSTDATTSVTSQAQSTSRQAYKTEIVGGVVVHTPVQQVLHSYDAFLHFTEYLCVQ